MTPSPETAGATREDASFRDPSGFVFRRDGVLYRQIDRVFEAPWRAFLSDGLYDRLVGAGLLIVHEEAPLELAASPDAVAVIRPRQVDFISYPYEWSFGQLKDAALATLRAQALAMERGFALRDASAFNVQFLDGKPVLIDSLSFAPAEPGRPWVAYRQFCQHFVAPLALAAHRDPRLILLLRDHLDGVPIDLAARLLPFRTRFDVGLASHVHLAARAATRAGGAETRAAAARHGEGMRSQEPRRVGRTGQEAILDSLRRTVEGLEWQPRGTTWAGYTTVTSYTERGAAAKRALVERFLGETTGRWVWDIGAGTGTFSRLAASLGRSALALDGDVGAVERAYRELKRDGETRVLPLVVDLANPTPALGWALRERRSIVERANADTILALALVHHLAIGNNVPLGTVADFLATLGPQLIIEFVPKEDAMVQAMLASREDVFPSYTLEGFRSAFGQRFEVAREEGIDDSVRTLFLMRSR